MGKTVAEVGAVVTAVALIATGIGAAAGAGLLGAEAAAVAGTAGTLSLFGVSVSEIALIGTGLSVVGGLLQGKPKVGGDYGTQVDWKADPSAGVPYIVGRTGVAGNIVLKDVAGDKNKYLFVTSVLSTGPVQSVSGYQADSVLVNFTGDSGEGASGGQLTTSLVQAAPAGGDVIVVGATQGFSAGQVITVGGESVTIKTVYSVGSELQLTGGLRAAHAANAAVVGPTSTDFYKNRMWRKVSLGPPSAPHLTFTATGSKDTPANHSGVPASWSASAKLSGLAHTIQAFEYDTAIYTTGEPKPLQVVEGVLCYDPRLDSTYAGGSGPHRWSDPRDRTQQGRFDQAQDSWGYSANPYIHALNWLLGRWDRNRADPAAYYVRTLGVGAPMQAIDVAAFVEAANVADANGWTIGNQFYSTDPKWDVLVSMLQAGCGRPLKLAAMVSCLVNAPKVSLDTLTGDDVVGEASIQATQAGRDRINAIWPRYREEAQGWQIVPTDAPIIVPEYVLADGGQRTKEVEYTCAAGGPDHVATLARYDIENSREFGPISLKCKPRWMGYKPGDCITVDEPEFGLNGQKCLILDREQDPSTMAVTLTLRSETDGKHAFALGQTANAPATPSLTGIDPSVVSVPTSAEWMAMGGQQVGPQGQALPVILITGSCSDPTIGQIIVEYRLADGDTWADWATLKADATSCQITGLAPQTAYVAGISYRSIRGVVGARLELDPTTTGGVATDWSSVTDPLELKPEDNATKGAHTGSNLYGADGSILTDGDVVTSQGTSASTADVPGTATFGGRGVADVLQQIQTIQSNIDALTGANFDGRIDDLHSALYGSDGNGGLNAQLNALAASLTPGSGSVYNGILQAAAQSASQTYATASSVNGLISEIGQPGDAANQTGTLFARIAYAQSTMADLSGYAKTTDLQQAIAGVTPKPNVVKNGAFGAVVTMSGAPVVANWTLAGDWAPYASDATYPTILRSTAAPGSGLGPVTLSDFYPVAAGSNYSGQATAIGGLNSGGRLELHFQWWNGNTQLPDTVLSIAPTGTWAVYTLPNVQAPSNATRGRVAVVLDNVTSNSFGVGVTRIKLEVSPYCTPFGDDDLSGSFSQLIQANVNALAGKADASVTTALAAEVGDPTNPAAGSIKAQLNQVLSVTVSRPDGLSFSQYIQSLSSTTPAGNANLVPNADLLLTSGGFPTNWSRQGVSYNSSDVNERGVFFDVGNTSNYALSDMFPMAAGTQYSLAATLYNSDTAGLVRCYLQFFNGSTFIGNSPVASIGQASWKYAAQAGFTAPANTTQARVCFDKVNFGSGGTAGWTRAKVEVGPVNTSFSDEALTAAVNLNAQAITTLAGQVYASAGLLVTANGTGGVKVAGVQAYAASGPISYSALELTADHILLHGDTVVGTIRNNANTFGVNADLGVVANFAGGTMKVLGAVFGQNGDLVTWFGPTPSGATPQDPKLSTLTKTNGYWAEGTDGKVYFGNSQLTQGGGGGGFQASKTVSGINYSGGNSYRDALDLYFTNVSGPGFWTVNATLSVRNGSTASGSGTIYLAEFNSGQQSYTDLASAPYSITSEGGGVFDVNGGAISAGNVPSHYTGATSMRVTLQGSGALTNCGITLTATWIPNGYAG